MKSDISFLFFLLLYGYMIDENCLLAFGACIVWRSASQNMEKGKGKGQEKHGFDMKIRLRSTIKKQSLNSDARYIHNTVLESNTVRPKRNSRQDNIV